MIVPKRLLMVVVLAAAMTACSAAKLGYLNADWLLVRQVDRYLDLDSEQRDWLQQRLESHIDWHRRDELPRIEAMLSSMQDRIEFGLTAEDVNWMLDESRHRYRVLARRLLPDMVIVLHGLDDGQIDHLERELREDMEDDDGRRDADDAVRRVERLTGRLDRNQRAEVRALFAREREASAEDDWRQRRAERSAMFVAALRERVPAAELTRMLEAWWIGPDEPDPDRRAEQVRVTLAINEILTDRQRNRVARTLDDYRQDVVSLTVTTAE